MNAIDWTSLAKDAVSPGDLVSAAAGGLPIYRVLAVADGKAWLQEDRHPTPQLMSLDRLCWKAAKHS
ncbi:hypothetical protein LJR225_004502 [Phenylobacterium sp. LjRoot225]|uniref:hypothetical protein n=1 Tax=Phenylobacterium sp. LjRoot225 TaxID=3342285 RepID=UPI003ECCC2FC